MNKNKALSWFDTYMIQKMYEPRKYQRESIIKVFDYFEAGAKVVALNAPTGSGKSIVGMAVANGMDSSYYVVCNLNLQDQINKEFTCHKDIRGRSNYKCILLDTTCDEGLCQKRKDYKCGEDCEYKIAKKDAIDAQITLTNVWYWILEGGRNFEKRELVIIDEGHNLPEMLVMFSRVKITSKNVTKEIFDRAVERYNMIDSQMFVEELMKDIDSEIDHIGEISELDDKGLKLLKRLQNMYVRLNNCILAGDILVEKFDWWFDIVPMKASAVAKKLLFDRADKVLMMSATINPFYIKNELDIERILGKKKLGYFNIPSTFPPERRKIFLMPVVNFKYANQTMENELKMVDAIIEIMKLYPDDKGLIFCQGYRYLEMLDGVDSRIITYLREYRKKAIKKWKEGFGNNVLAGVKMEEGEDLKDNMARFSIIFKSPIPGTLDIRVKERIKRNEWNWLFSRAQCMLVQAAGRIVRSETDYGDMWVLDEGACKLFKRKGIPQYIKDAIINLDYKKWKEERENG